MASIALKSGLHYRYNFSYGPAGGLAEKWDLFPYIEEWLYEHGIEYDTKPGESFRLTSGGSKIPDVTLFLHFANPSDATLFKLTWA